MPAQNHLLHKAISFYQSGDCDTARRLLLGILRGDETNQTAWIWYAETFSTVQERLNVFRDALKAYPQMREVRKAYHLLQQNLYEQSVPWIDQHFEPVARPAPRSEPRQSARPAPRDRRTSLAWTLLSLLVIFSLLMSTFYFSLRMAVESQQASSLRQENARLETDYALSLSDLLKEQQGYRLLKGQYDALTAQKNDLTQRFNGLTQQYAALDGEHNRLVEEHNRLVGEHKALTDNYTVLSDQNRELENRYTSLTNNYSDLSQKAIVPPYIAVHQRQVTMAFYKRDQSILYWTVPFESLERSIERGDHTRGENVRVTLPTDDGAGYDGVDILPFIDASVFSKVIPDLYRQAGSDEAFIREVWNIIVQLTAYASDPENNDTPRYPLETLLAGGGDCEDTSILFASMIKAAPVSWTVSVVYMNANHPLDRSDPNHVIVAINTGYTWYLVETTSDTEMTPYTQGVDGWFFQVP